MPEHGDAKVIDGKRYVYKQWGVGSSVGWHRETVPYHGRYAYHPMRTRR